MRRRQQHSLAPGIDARFPRVRDVLDEDARVVFAYLFGSFGLGRPTLLSEIDIAVFLEGSADIAEAKLDLIGDLTHALDTDEVDLIVLNEAPLSLAGRIQQSRRVLVDKNRNRRLSYESLMRRQFADFAIQERVILFRRFGIDR